VLATFCWTKSLLCNVAAFTGMLLYLESTLQLCSSRRFCEVFKEVHFVSCQPSRRRDIPSRRSSVSNIRPDDVVFLPDAHLSKHHPSDDENFMSGRPSVSRSFEQFKVASVRT